MLYLFVIFFLTPFAQAALQPITITAKRAQFNGNPQTTQASKISALTINERQYRQLNDALGALSSLMVVSAGGIGQQTAVFSRGLSANQLQVRVDGMRMNSPSDPTGSFDFANSNNMAIKQITVTRGLLSSFYGTGTLGGVIDIRTKTGKDCTERQAYFEAGSHDTARGQIGGQGNARQYHFSLYGSGTKTGGYQQTLPHYRLGMGDYKKLPYQSRQVAAAVGTHRDYYTLTFYNRFYTAQSQFHNNQGTMLPHHQRQSLHRLELVTEGDWQHRFGLGTLLTHQISAPGQVIYSQNKGKRMQFDWQQQIPLNKFHNVAVFVEAGHDHMSVKTPGCAIDKSQQQLSGAFYHTALINKLTIESVLRAERSNHFKVPVTGGFGLSYTFSPGAKFYTNLSTTFRAPSLYQLFGKNLYFEGNPDLKPEKGQGLEVGLKQQLNPNITLVSSYFKYEIKKLIEAVPGRYINMNFAKSQGVDTILNWHAMQDFELEGGYCYTKAVDHLKRSLLRRPQHKFVMKATLRKETWLLAADIVFVGKRIDINPVKWTHQTAKAYTIVNVKGSYTLNQGWQLFARIDNLLNRQIEEPLGYRKSGISLYAGLQSQF